MARPDKVGESGRFRAVAAASLDGVAGTFGTTDASGDGDLLAVAVDGNGQLVLADANACDGVIWIPESRRVSHRVSLAETNEAIGGKTYTVFDRAEIAELEAGEDPLAAGDRVYSAAAGGISTVDDTGVYLGVVLPNPVTGADGLRLVLRVESSGAAGS